MIAATLPLSAVEVDSEAPDPGTVAATTATLGQDPDGRIPLIAKPAEIAGQERWRYIPAARVKEGGFIERFGITTFAVPFVFSEEAIGTGVGIGLIDIDFMHHDRRDTAALFASRTTLGQEQYALVWQHLLQSRRMPDGGILQKETSFIDASANYSNTLTERFFGLGPDTTKQDETSYTDRATWAEIGVQGEPTRLPDLIGQVHLRAEHHQLAAGEVPGEPSTTVAYPTLTSEADDITSLIVRTGVIWDTRDSSANPYRGYSLGVEADSYLDSGGPPAVILTGTATFTQSIPSLFHDGGLHDLRTRGPEENPPTDVIAVGGFWKRAYGDLPFYYLPSLGGANSLRGYVANRFVDAVAWDVSAEWRTWILPRGFTIYDDIRVERLGLAPFCDIGRVGHDAQQALAGPVEVNPGISLRMEFERAFVLRLDVARSADQIGVNFEAGMSF